MATVKIEDVWRIGDIHHTNLSPESLEALKDHSATWQDMRLKEDIYNVNDLVDDPDPDIDPVVLKELTKINAALNRKRCGYLRIVYVLLILVTLSSCNRRSYCFGEWDKRPRGLTWAASHR